ADDRTKGAEESTQNVADALADKGAPVVAELRDDQSAAPVPQELAPLAALVRREITLSFPPWTWVVTVEHSVDPGAEWLEISDGPSRPDRDMIRRLGLRLSLAHPFMQRFAGANAELIEPILRVAVALGLGETIARESAAPGAF